MNWDDLRYVLETVRQGGLSGAARALGVNHATVARRITAAEDSLGTPLFDRRLTGYVPTEAGQDAARAAEDIDARHAALTRAIAARDAMISGPLTITAPQLLIQYTLAPVLRDFAAAYPDVQVTALGANAPLNLAHREADVAIRISNDPDPDLFGRKVAEQRAAVYASHSYVAQLQADPDQRLEWIRFLHWQRPGAAVEAAYPNMRIAMHLDDMVAMLGALRAGIGASRLPCFLGDSDSELIRVPGIPLQPYTPIWILTHSDMRHVPRIAAFTDFVWTAMRSMRPAFLGD
ncbi:LysR family transcriptional regulator [Tateyamaria sp.]|uniref:LysR family transcriptional regulator n=1 Tax=Tateyamaria sp. TaxID=1929288 RepID=UPI003B21E6ED